LLTRKNIRGRAAAKCMLECKKLDTKKLDINAKRCTRGQSAQTNKRSHVLHSRVNNAEFRRVYSLQLNGQEIASVDVEVPKWFPGTPKLKKWFLRWVMNDALRTHLRAA
jgi:hypothetical protein